jgi:hypothetical protein
MAKLGHPPLAPLGLPPLLLTHVEPRRAVQQRNSRLRTPRYPRVRRIAILAADLQANISAHTRVHHRYHRQIPLHR